MNATLYNLRFYNKVAARYDKADGRRGKRWPWLESNIKLLAECKNMTLLDVGAGTGFVSKIAADYFKVTALDVSVSMLEKIEDSRIKCVQYDGGRLPFDDNSFDVVVTFATLHHIDRIYSLFQEIKRVLKPGGTYYSDHDLDSQFYNKHRFLIELYRRIHNAPARFQVNPEEYKASETHCNGIDADTLRLYLSRTFGSLYFMHYHWYGLAPFRITASKVRNAPLIRIVARKGFK